MPYTKVGPWVNGAPPALSAANLDTVETQYEQAIADVRGAMKPALVRWVIPGWFSFTVANNAVTANRIYFTPIHVPVATSFDRIGINVAVGDGAGGVADLRIFAWLAGIPGALILNAGTVSTNGAGAQEIVIAQALGIGFYFLAVRCTQAPTLEGLAQGNPVSAPVGGFATSNAVPAGVVLYDDAAYADPAGAVDGVLGCDWAFVRLREA